MIMVNNAKIKPAILYADLKYENYALLNDKSLQCRILTIQKANTLSTQYFK